MSDWVKVAREQDVPAGRVKVVVAGGERIALAHTEQGFRAIQDKCTHDNGPLGEGTVSGEEVECPRHGARFNVKTGQPVTLPAVIPVKTYPVKVEKGEILVQV